MRGKNGLFRKVVIAMGAAAIASMGASLIHPSGATDPPGSDSTLLLEAQIDPETRAIIERACQDCHSQKTEWPWYGRMAPVSWILARDVQQARMRLNLSRWGDYSSDDRFRLLSEIGSAVRNQEMPVQRYVWLHPSARLTDLERQRLYRWTRSERIRLSRGQRRPVPLRVTASPE